MTGTGETRNVIATSGGVGRATDRRSFIIGDSMSKQERVGFIKARSEVLIIGDAFCLDERWKTPSGSITSFAIDITGEKAEYLAKRDANMKCERLSDGTWRVHVPNAMQAAIVNNEIKKYITQNATKAIVTVTPLGSSRTQGLDAARGGGVGMVELTGTAFAALRVRIGQEIEVREVRDARGELLHVMVIPVAPPQK